MTDYFRILVKYNKAHKKIFYETVNDFISDNKFADRAKKIARSKTIMNLKLSITASD